VTRDAVCFTPSMMFPAPHVVVVVEVEERRAWDARLLGASEGALTGRTPPARISRYSCVPSLSLRLFAKI
jgi:hypothetical protein